MRKFSAPMWIITGCPTLITPLLADCSWHPI